MSTRHSARLFECAFTTQAYDEVDADRLRPGDLVHCTATGMWYGVRTGPDELMSLKRVFIAEGDAVVTAVTVGRSLTDAFPDALAHYRDAASRLDANHRLIVVAHPQDAGFRREFALRDSDALLWNQFETVAAALLDGVWWLYDVTFDGHPELVLHRSCIEHTALALDATPRNVHVHLTRNVAWVVGYYRAWLQQPERAFLVFDACFSSAKRISLGYRLNQYLGVHYWHVFSSYTPLDGTFVAHIAGPLSTMASAIANVPFALLRRMCSVRLLSIVTRQSRRSRNSISSRRRLLDYDSLVERHRYGANHLQWSSPGRQWPAVHRFVLDRALALAPLCLPPYVLLEILERLPELRFHVHKQVVDLLVGVQRSVQRVLAR